MAEQYAAGFSGDVKTRIVQVPGHRWRAEVRWPHPARTAKTVEAAIDLLYERWEEIAPAAERRRAVPGPYAPEPVQ